MPSEELLILLADDDDGHANLIQRNLKRAGIANKMQHVRDGQEALDFVHCEGAYGGRILDGPLLILLDIKMPRMDGVEVLLRLKGDLKTMQIPIIMFTTTDDPREIRHCYELGCSVYVTKPVLYEEFIEAIKRLGLFLTIVKLPREDGRGGVCAKEVGP